MFQIILNNMFCAVTVFYNPKMEQMFTPHFEHYSTVKLGSSNLNLIVFIFVQAHLIYVFPLVFANIFIFDRFTNVTAIPKLLK